MCHRRRGPQQWTQQVELALEERRVAGGGWLAGGDPNAHERASRTPPPRPSGSASRQGPCLPLCKPLATAMPAGQAPGSARDLARRRWVADLRVYHSRSNPAREVPLVCCCEEVLDASSLLLARECAGV